MNEAQKPLTHTKTKIKKSIHSHTHTEDINKRTINIIKREIKRKNKQQEHIPIKST